MNKKTSLFTIQVCLIHFFIATSLTTLLATPPVKPAHPPTGRIIPLLKGCIVSSELDTMPEFKIYYKGTQTVNNDDGFFSIPLEDQSSKLSLLICKDFKPNFKAINTIENLSINPQKKYLFYSFTKATLSSLQKKVIDLEEKIRPLAMRLRLIERQIERHEKKQDKRYSAEYYEKNLKKLRLRKLATTKKLRKIESEKEVFEKKYLTFQNATPQKPAGDFWFIQRKNAKNKKQFIVPDNCVIVCLNPKTVDHVENWNFSLSKNFVSFPRIVLKKNLETRNVKSKQSITRSALKSEFTSLGKKVFHETKKETFKYFDTEPNVRVSLLQ